VLSQVPQHKISGKSKDSYNNPTYQLKYHITFLRFTGFFSTVVPEKTLLNP
jgi:hypothetical protein